jgi:hypothetical protein
MILVSILLPLLLQSAAPVKQASLVELQARAAQAHKAYRERARSAQRCEAGTATLNAMAAKAAADATQRRRQLLTDLASRPEGLSAPAVDSPGAEEVGKAVSLLSRDLEISAALMAKADPKYEAPAARGFLGEAASLPQPAALAGAAGGARPDLKSAAVSMLGDLTTEESLLNSYFSSSRLEIERECFEKNETAADPFRVPARDTKRAKGVRK